MALTVTATEAVIADIATQVKLTDLRVINTGIYRENLHYRLVHTLEDGGLVAQEPSHSYRILITMISRHSARSAYRLHGMERR